MSDVEILHGDCLELMAALPAGSVDAIVTDPPYGIAYQSARRTDKAARLARVVNDESPFVAWLPGAFRAAAPFSALICFCVWRSQEAFREAIEAAGFVIRSQVIWDRVSHGMGDPQTVFAPQHDIIWFASKGRYEFPGKRPTSVLRYPRVAPSQLRHPNEKPLGLMSDLIRSIVRPGDLVLDPFAGSGSTLVAAMKTGRRAIGMELDPEYVALAERRVAEAKTPLFDEISA